MSPPDVIVVGGGLTGSATALNLARAGLKVTVFEHRHFPRDKPCGEGIMPHGVRLLDQLELLPRIPASESRPFRGIEYIVGGDVRARGEFPVLTGGYRTGLGVRRLLLDNEAMRLASSHPNVKFHQGIKVTGLLKRGEQVVGVKTADGSELARLVIGADGRGSMVRHQLGLDVAPRTRPRYGVRAHLEFDDEAGVGEFVEVYRDRGGEVYTTPVGPRTLLVALLLEKPAMAQFKGKLEEAFTHFLSSEPHLKQRFQAGRLCSEVLACGPLACSSLRPYSPGALLVGDAAGFIDAITGEGMSLGLATARAAAEVAVEALANDSLGAASLAPYHTKRQKIIRHYAIMTSTLLALSRFPRLSRWVVERLGRRPQLFTTLLGINCGEFGIQHIPLREVGRFLLNA